jgi:UDP-N-acetylglucosamine 1-carboxyvinyltransferase
MEDAYIIQGGKKLQGDITLSGAKNVALKIIIGALMLDQEVVLHNIPRIRDVAELINLIGSLGGKVKYIDKNSIVVDGRTLNSNKVDLIYASKIRVSFMMLAPLLAKFGDAYIPNPGGCRLGARSIDRSVEGIRKLGIDVEYDSESGYYYAKLGKKRPRGAYEFPKPSHTGTEFLIMTALLTSDEVILDNTALEPEIDNLIRFFNSCGAKITKHKRHVRIEKHQFLRQLEPFSIMSDRIEAVTYAVLGVVTKGWVMISEIEKPFIQAFILKAEECGVIVEHVKPKTWKFSRGPQLKSVRIETEPYPGFLTDWQPLCAVLLTQARGSSIIHERIFENRFSYVNELKKLGADIEHTQEDIDNPEYYYHFNYDPSQEYNQAIKIKGPMKLHNGVLTVSDMRAGATLAIAALSAEGESVVNGASHIERGYEDFVEKVTRLGGEIKKV